MGQPALLVSPPNTELGTRNPTLLALPSEFFALAHEPGRISEPAQALLDNFIGRLPPSDRARLE